MIRSFSYPSPGQCFTNGRANLKGTSVFYASDYAIAAMLESKQRGKEIGFLSLWKPKVDRDVLSALFLPKNLKPDNPWVSLSNDLHTYLANQNQTLKSEKKAQLDLLNHFICVHLRCKSCRIPK